MNPRAIGMVGLGLLGSALAERFVQAGFAVTGFDLDPARRDALAQYGQPVASAPAVVTPGCRLVLCLPTSAVVATVLDEMGPVLQEGLVIVDTTTGDPQQTAALGAQLAERRIHYLDATVVGSSAHARQADTVVMAGGERAAFDACADLFACFARQWFHVGAWGAGARLKLVVNLVLGLNRAVLAEGLAFARACGVDPAEALQVLRAGAAYSRVMDTKGPKMVAEDFTCQAKLAQHLKDVRLILAEGGRVDAVLPFSAIHELLLQQLLDAGLGEVDNAAIIRAFGPQS